MQPELSKTFDNYSVVLRPDRHAPGWWAGAPSVVRAADGTFYLVARMRGTDNPPGQRGYELRILKSRDGIRFEPIHAIRREDAGVRGFERAALVVDPVTKRFRLYACATTDTMSWHILVFDEAASPEELSAHTARPVLEPPPSWGLGIEPGYKDPLVLWAEGRWHLYVIAIDRIERVYHFTSADGHAWEGDPANPVLDVGGWHNYHTRPASVSRVDNGYLFIYEGSNAQWHDPNYNIATGLAFTRDMTRIVDLTREAPWIVSSTPGRYLTWRYSHWLQVKDEWYVYAECACPDDTNELRLFRIPAHDVIS